MYKIPGLAIEVLIQLVSLWTITGLGNTIIKWGFSKVEEKKEDDGNRLGRHIGNAERIIVTFGILQKNWEIITAIVALKALARFQKMDDKTFAEYFLIGSAWSLIYCIVFAFIYDRYVGFFDPVRLDNIENLISIFTY